MIRFTLVLLMACAPTVFAADADSPEAELASFQVADGFEVSLFASEKEGVVKPIQIRFDERGRLWVIGSTVYPQIEPGQIPNDKVLVLEDTNGDGRSDKTTVFADGLVIPTGLELGHGGVYVGHGTELLHLTDTDGDGKADRRRVVLRGFGTGDNHQNINSFRWGPGGELWMCQGLHTFSNVETPWGVARMNQAGLWRLRPRLSRLDGFYGSAYEPQNPWGYVFTHWGEPLVIAGNNSSSIYPVPGLVANYRPDAPPLIWKNGNGRKSSGGEIVGTAHFPNAWQGVVILGGYINNAVWALKLSDDGAGFALEDLPPLIKSTSRSFRPVDAKFGPDGALYLCDWCNPIIGHYQASFRHPDRDKTRGRIWRVTAKGRPLTQPPQLDGAPILSLLHFLRSPDSWTRRFAKRVLADRPTGPVIEELDRWTVDPLRSEHELVEALGVYLSHETPAPDLLARLCRAKEPGARAYAASVVGALAGRLTDPLGYLRPLASDGHPRVRLQAVVACTYVFNHKSMEVAAIAADHPTDKFLSYALNQAVHSLKPHWLGALKAGRLDLENKPARLGLLVRADGTSDTLSVLRSRAHAADATQEQREIFRVLLAEVGDPSDLAKLLDPETFTNGGAHDAPGHARVLEALAQSARVRSVRPFGDLAAHFAKLKAARRTDDMTTALLRLAIQWRTPVLTAEEMIAVASRTLNPSLRVAAASAIATLGGAGAPQLLESLAERSRAEGVRVAAAVGLASLDLPRAASIAADIMSSDAGGAGAEMLLPAILTRQGGAGALAKAFSTLKPSKASGLVGMRLMSAGGQRDAALYRLFSDAAGLLREGKALSAPAMAAFVSAVQTQGNALRGERIFRREDLGCVACHAIQGTGGDLGPNLSALGTAQPIDFIVGAILEPQKEIKEGYASISVSTRDGEEYQGYFVRENREELVFRDVLQKKEVRVRRDRISERRDNGSVMPEGLVDVLTNEEFVDLVRYLSELGTPR